MTKFVASLLRALGFLTRIPIPSAAYADKGTIADDAYIFPLAGAIISSICAIILIICMILGFSALTASFMAILVITVMTGALHEDGLADVADAFFMPKDIQTRLKIMKDSHIGTFGVLALIGSIGLKTLLFTELAGQGYAILFCTLIGADCMSRSAMIWIWTTTPLVRPDGVAAQAGRPDGQQASKAILIASLIVLLAEFILSGILASILALLVTALSGYAFKKLTLNKIGGHTGDVLGASQQITYIGFLIGTLLGLG